MPAKFSTLLDKKQVCHFVYVNPIAFNKRAWSGWQSSKIFSDSARQRLIVIFAKNVCSHCNALSPWDELENAVSEMTIMKGTAHVMGRQLRHLHRPHVVEASSIPTREKSILSPFIFVTQNDKDKIFLYFSPFAICKHVNLKLSQYYVDSVRGYISEFFSVICDFA